MEIEALAEDDHWIFDSDSDQIVGWLAERHDLALFWEVDTYLVLDQAVLVFRGDVIDQH